MEELKTLFTNIANAIRVTGVTEGEMTLADMPDLIASIENEALQGYSIAELYNTAAKDISAIGTTIDPSSCDTINDVFTKIWDDGYRYGWNYQTDNIWRDITDYAISQGYPLREDFKLGGKYYENFEEFIGWLIVEAEKYGYAIGSNG